MTNDDRLQEAKTKTLELSQMLSDLNTFIQNNECISPIMQQKLEEKIDEILLKTVQLLRITKSKK